MNSVAEGYPCLVAYPAQAAAANQSKCWSWSKATDQKRDRGEPSLIADITRQIIGSYGVDARRVHGAAHAWSGGSRSGPPAEVNVHGRIGTPRDEPSANWRMK